MPKNSDRGWKDSECSEAKQATANVEGHCGIQAKRDLLLRGL